MMSLNNSNYEENLLLSLPAALAMTGGGMIGGGDNNESFIPITTQNYTEKYRDLERLNDELKKNNDELKRLYKSLKTDHTRSVDFFLNLTTWIRNQLKEQILHYKNRQKTQRYRKRGNRHKEIERETKRSKEFERETKNTKR